MDSPVGSVTSEVKGLCRSGSPRTAARLSEQAPAQGKSRSGKGAGGAASSGGRPGAQGAALPAPLSEAVYRKALEELPDGARMATETCIQSWKVPPCSAPPAPAPTLPRRPSLSPIPSHRTTSSPPRSSSPSSSPSQATGAAGQSMAWIPRLASHRPGRPPARARALAQARSCGRRGRRRPCARLRRLCSPASPMLPALPLPGRAAWPLRAGWAEPTRFPAAGARPGSAGGQGRAPRALDLRGRREMHGRDMCGIRRAAAGQGGQRRDREGAQERAPRPAGRGAKAALLPVCLIVEA